MPVLKPRSGSGDAPQQFKQTSRKGKKAWRKNVDVTEVEEGLEELNKEIIQGGVVAEKASADLFTLDTVGDVAISRRLPKSSKKTLKADEIIAQRSAVPAVSLRKRPADSTDSGASKRQKKDWVSKKELDRLRQVADGRHATSIAIREAEYDVWGAPAPRTDSAPGEDPSFVPREKPAVKAPKTLGRKPISLAVSGKAVPSVIKPSGGYSYNPSFEEYADRLEEESAKAIAAEKARLEAEEADRLKQEAAARSAAEAEAAEARANLSEWDEDSAWEGFESGVEDDGKAAATKRPERKTQAQRNKIKRRKEEERQLKHAAAMKKRAAAQEKIKQIAKEVEERERQRALALAAKESDSESEGNDEVLRRKQLGKYRLPEKDLELVLPDELQESLRLLKPEGNLLRDRYRSLLVRGKVESRRHIPFKKQAKTKLTEKWSYKDFSI